MTRDLPRVILVNTQDEVTCGFCIEYDVLACCKAAAAKLPDRQLLGLLCASGTMPHAGATRQRGGNEVAVAGLQGLGLRIAGHRGGAGGGDGGGQAGLGG